MDLKEIAETLVAGCKAGTEFENLDKLYAEDCLSVEAVDGDGQGRERAGLEAIKGKHTWWDENFTVHSSEVRGPFLHGEDRFGVIFKMDAEMKATGERWDMEEIGVYHVAGGKIVREEFFYTM